MRNADAWRHDSIYRSIKKISKQKVKHTSLAKALKYAICRKKFEILRLVKLGRRDDDESDSDNDDVFEKVRTTDMKSDNDDVFESDNDGVDILKKLAPTVVERESESDSDGYEGDSKSENDDESTAKRKKLSETRNPYIDYYVKQAMGQSVSQF
jgi:hypothetical protein